MSEMQNDELVLEETELQLARNQEEMDLLEVTAATLESIHREMIASGKVSRDQVDRTLRTLGIESLNGYPATAFTQYPTKTNFQVAQEGLIGNIVEIFTKTIKAIFKFIGDFFAGIWKFLVGIFNLIFRRDSTKKNQTAVNEAMFKLDSIPKASFDDRRVSDKNAAYKKALDDYSKNYTVLREDLFTKQTWMTIIANSCVSFRQLLNTANQRLDLLKTQLDWSSQGGLVEQQYTNMAKDWSFPPSHGVEQSLKEIYPEAYNQIPQQDREGNQRRYGKVVKDWVSNLEHDYLETAKKRTSSIGNIVPAEVVYKMLSDTHEPLNRGLVHYSATVFTEEDRKLIDQGNVKLKVLEKFTNPDYFKKNKLEYNENAARLFIENLKEVQDHILAVHAFITKVWAPYEVELTRLTNDVNRVIYAKLNRDIAAAKLHAQMNQDTETFKQIDGIVKVLSGYNPSKMSALTSGVSEVKFTDLKQPKE